MIFRLILIVVIIKLALISPAVYAAVEVTLNDTKHTFSDNPRLVDVLAPIALQEQWYWPASKLFRTNTHRSEKLRTQIVGILATENTRDNKQATIYKAITTQINSWQVADRIKINIDFELARITVKHNPIFENGQYRVVLSERPTNLYIFGAINEAIDMPLNNNTCIENIMSKIELSDSADKSFVYLISSHGTVQKHPTAYWNSNCSLPMPGSVVYVPLLEDAFSNTANLINTKIIALATNKVTAQ